MKIYTNTFDLARISPHRFWVAPYSDFKFGVKIVKNGEAVENDFAVKAGGVALTADETKIDGFTTYTIKSNGTGFVEYSIEVEDVTEKLKLLQIVTDSTVFEVGGEGGGDVPADVATKTWVNSQISGFITEDALDGYATEDYVDSAISDFVTDDELTAYATKNELTGYATKDELTGYAETSDLTAYATKDELTAYAEEDELTAYATKAELTAYAEETELTAYATKDELTGYVQNGDLTAYATVDSLSDYAEASALTAYAEKTDIKDSTITITQGGVTKGSFTLNQATGDTIELDTGGGSSAISAYAMSEDPVMSKTEVEMALNNKICLPQTIVKYADNSISVFNVTGNLKRSINPTDGYVPLTNAIDVAVGTQITCLYDGVFSGSSQLSNVVIPDSVKKIEQEAFRFSNISPITVPDSVSQICLSAFATNKATVVDFGNTRKSVPSLYTAHGSGWFSNAVSAYVPDNLYDTWIATTRWNNISAQIYRHSELETPYTTQLAKNSVVGGAETGATGTPASVNAIKSVYETDWQTLSSLADANTFYVVVPDPD